MFAHEKLAAAQHCEGGRKNHLIKSDIGKTLFARLALMLEGQTSAKVASFKTMVHSTFLSFHFEQLSDIGQIARVQNGDGFVVQHL